MKNIHKFKPLIITSLLFYGLSCYASPAKQCTSVNLKPNLYYHTTEIQPHIFELAKKAYDCAHKKGLITKPDLLTVIDYSLPSTVKRLWVYQLSTGNVLYNIHVAHGKNTGMADAKWFSNQLGSDKTSIGTYLTGKAYVGHDGYAMRLYGLEKGFNDKAMKRAVVMHGAWYVSPKFLKTHHRLGRSWGCEAIDKQYIKPVVHHIRDGSIIVAYYPSTKWLTSSEFLHCAAAD